MWLNWDGEHDHAVLFLCGELSIGEFLEAAVASVRTLAV
jgi:hypothetical protein